MLEHAKLDAEYGPFAMFFAKLAPPNVSEGRGPIRQRRIVRSDTIHHFGKLAEGMAEAEGGTLAQVDHQTSAFRSAM